MNSNETTILNYDDQFGFYSLNLEKIIVLNILAILDWTSRNRYLQISAGDKCLGLCRYFKLISVAASRNL